MQVEFKKITKIPKEFELNLKNVKFFGEFKKSLNDSNLVEVNATLKGEIETNCDRCGEEFNLNIDEKLNLKVYNGIYKGEDDVLEVEEVINFEEILIGEIELIKSDYHICSKCENIENFEVEF